MVTCFWIMCDAGPSGRVGLPGVLAEAVLYSGFVGLACHYTQRLEVAAKTMPPYDEFRLLEESWKSMRIVVEVSKAQVGKEDTVHEGRQKL